MYIERFVCQEHNASGDWLVKGEIYIKGEFSREEWEKIKVAFMAMGLAQLSRGPKPSESLPSRQEFIAAIMEDARNNSDGEALRRLKKKYHIPQLLDIPVAANGGHKHGEET